MNLKKWIWVFACSGAFTGTACAQTSVTLYGVVNAAVLYDNNDGGKRDVSMQSPIPNRWGLKGSEDLGGGLRAIFQLENGFSVANGAAGQGGLLFGRQAFVGLADSQWGTLTLGRQYDLIADYLEPLTMNGIWGADYSHGSDIDNTDDAYRINNAIKFASPTYRGFTAAGMYAFGGVPGEFGANSMFALSLNYSNGPLRAAAVYEYARDPATQFADAPFKSNVATGPTLNAVDAGQFAIVGKPASSQIFGVGGSYAIGAATIGADYTNTNFGDANGTQSSVRFDNYEFWGTYSPNSATTLIAGYTLTTTRIGYATLYPNPDWDQFNLMLDYALSRRTDVYLMGVYQTATGGAHASIYSSTTGVSSTRNQVLFGGGVRTRF
jgi:predicted porin